MHISGSIRIKCFHGETSHYKVTLIRREWNQLVHEMNSWLILGRELESLLNDRENAVI